MDLETLWNMRNDFAKELTLYNKLAGVLETTRGYLGKLFLYLGTVQSMKFHVKFVPFYLMQGIRKDLRKSYLTTNMLDEMMLYWSALL